MTQVTSTFLAGEDEQPGQPFGFASPAAPPLSTSEPPRAVTPGPVAPPQDFAPPAQQVAPLDQIAPAPADRRDPHEPLLDALPPEAVSAWDPTQPVPGSATSDALNAASEPDTALSPQQLGSLPPPSGLPVGAQPWPAPVGTAQPQPGVGAPPGAGAQPGVGAQPAGPQTMRPVAQSPYPTGPSPYPANPYAPAPSPYGPNPYATGSYSQDGYYPAPGGPSRPPAQEVPQITGWLIGLLFVGMLWSGLAPWALLGAGILAATNNVPGRIMLLVCAAFTLVVAFFWFQGYFYIDQLQSTARLLCFVCLVGLAITMRNKPQRRY
ncbi:MAG: hypothetical protein VB040_08885 [Propionibacterium sp.]|jgi:hypothetical protein|nr:hypothetical protein [Propionibacterium sp.]